MARLALTPTELDAFASQVDRILAYVAQLAEVDPGPEAVDRCGTAGSLDGSRCPLRSDEEDEPDALARPPVEDAPAWAENFFVVPRLAAWDGERDAP